MQSFPWRRGYQVNVTLCEKVRWNMQISRPCVFLSGVLFTKRKFAPIYVIPTMIARAARSVAKESAGNDALTPSLKDGNPSKCIEIPNTLLVFDINAL